MFGTSAGALSGRSRTSGEFFPRKSAFACIAKVFVVGCKDDEIKKNSGSHDIDRKIQAWLKEHPEYKQLGNLESVEDRGSLVDRCNKMLEAFGSTTGALSEQIGVSEDTVNLFLERVHSHALLKYLLSVEKVAT